MVKMQCPKCKDSKLKAVTVKNKNIEIDRCSSCKGLWFDKGELDGILGVKAIKDLAIPKFSLHMPDRKCPKCNKGLYEFCYPETTTFVDACAECGGIWLDNQEWKEISAARDIKNKMHCPKCNTLQRKSDTCIHCGIVFKKYYESKEPPKIKISPVLASTEVNIPTSYGFLKESYADDIPGIKGMLLKFIDNSFDKFLSQKSNY